MYKPHKLHMRVCKFVMWLYCRILLVSCNTLGHCLCHLFASLGLAVAVGHVDLALNIVKGTRRKTGIEHLKKLEAAEFGDKLGLQGGLEGLGRKRERGGREERKKRERDGGGKERRERMKGE